MISLTTVTCPRATLREMVRLDVPRLVRIAEQTSTPHRTRQDFLAALQAGAGAVAEIEGQTVGFVVYQVTLPPGGSKPTVLKKLLLWCLPWCRGALASPRHVDLRFIAVLPQWHRQGIGRALLEKVRQAFRRSGDHLQAVVPETNLPVQLLLRDAGYRAVRVVPDYYGSEDGYVMEHMAGPALTCCNGLRKRGNSRGAEEADDANE